MRPPYQLNDDRSMVCAAFHGLGKTLSVVVWEADLPASPLKVVQLMNEAYREGFERAQVEMRHALGIR